ncbi:MAG: hypothetical protein QOE90_3688 [Thermoplasmata archaeon]|jgi:hypothetical protein|nr:hypothetical protein [Thermoplasmata archaeon]
MQRLTISLDDDLAGALDSLAGNGGDSKANLVRRALRMYLKRQRGRDRPTDFDLRTWAELLANREHVILDVAHVRLFFEQLAGSPDSFWTGLREIGAEHGRQYRDKGMADMLDMLRVMESANWFYLAPESDRSWALILTEPSAKPFVKAFLDGFASQLDGRAEVIEERTKLRVKVSDPRVGHPRHGALHA